MMRRRKTGRTIDKGRLWRDNDSESLIHREVWRGTGLNTDRLDDNCQPQNCLQTLLITDEYFVV